MIFPSESHRVTQLLLLLLLSCLSYLVSFTEANPAVENIMSHHTLPTELDVTSKSCAYNSNTGFAGDIGDDFFSVDYYYTLLVASASLGNTQVVSLREAVVNFDALPDNSIHNVIYQIELGIGSYLLKESGEFQSAPCNMRRLVHQRKQDIHITRERQLEPIQNVGLTVGPDDEILSECESDDPDTLCYLVAGSFQVYTLGTEGNTTQAQKNIQQDLKTAMNSGTLNRAHTAIVDITYLDNLPIDSPDQSNGGGTDPNGNNINDGDTITSIRSGPDAAIIVSASVGAVLLVAAIALVSRRRNRHDEQTFFQASSMDVSEFHMSREESVVESTTTEVV